MSLYDFANGDPVNGFDPDGRLATKFWNIVQGVGDVTADNMDGGYPQDSPIYQRGVKVGADIADYGWAGIYINTPILNSGISTLEILDGNTVTGQPMNGWDYVAGTVNSVGSATAVYGFTSSLLPTTSEITQLTKVQRLDMVYDQVNSAPVATTADEAMQQMHGTLEAVEDAYSGVPKNPSPSLKPDGRMYPAQADRIVVNPDGSMSATSLKQVTTYGADGSITVIDRATGQVMFQKKGGG